MAYTIVKSNGTILTTIPDGTINTTSTSLGLPGRNYAGYGQSLDTNFVHIVENFANSSPPAHPMAGQLWFNTNANTLCVCPTDGETSASNWLTLATTSSGGTTTFGALTVTGNILAGNVYANIGTIGSANLTTGNLTVSINADIAAANITSATIGTLTTTAITTGSTSTPGTLTGTWTINGTASGNAAILTSGNLYITPSYGVKSDNYYYANGTPISFAGTYNDSNVALYLPTYAGIVGTGAATFRGNVLTTGANSSPGSITGTWSLTTGSKLQATYADLAERFEADDLLEPGTVVEIGGEKEITAVKYELSEDVFGVVSNTAAYLMNSAAGDDNTHPPIAVSGRVQVKVTGKVLKGQRLVSAGNGFARAALSGEATAFNTIGRALVDKLTTDIGTVEAIVMIR